MSQYTPNLSVLRRERTRLSNRVRASMSWMLTQDATHTSPDGLQSWWPFWSDCLKGSVIETVRAARLVARAEGTPLEEERS